MKASFVELLRRDAERNKGNCFGGGVRDIARLIYCSCFLSCAVKKRRKTLEVNIEELCLNSTELTSAEQ